jgi:ABC-type multidrug transport system ATPase subunit
MAQRLAIARAVLHNPPVLLLDEPDTGLDPSGAAMLHDLIHVLGASNRAILFTTHNLERALAWSDSVCILHNGKIVYSANSAELDVVQLGEIYGEIYGELYGELM